MYQLAAASAALLDLVCETTPPLFTISTPQENKKGTLFLTFRKPATGPDVECRKITITIPVGQEPTDLVGNTSGADADDIDDYPRDSTGLDWTIERQTTPEKPGSPSEVTAITFTCTPPSGETTFGAGREFTLILSSVPINRTAGAAPLTITETTTTGTGTGWADRPIALPAIEKAGNEFRFQNFSCVKPRVAHGEATVLQWDGTPHNTEYYLYWDDAPAKRLTDLPAQPPLTVPTHQLTRTTTFVLNAQTRNAANQTVHHYLSTTVTVKDPDILAKSLTAADKVDVTDTFVADRTNANKTWARATTFDGDVTIT
ncbi:hypothetical protein ACIG5E_16885 [Kitasatospora sp. NPDC053057]|uniref:hypothetical protein n=1 Tax=Kitasatospora sp. NPDC053057 TaxID=3364062 RepID=UPI0037C892D0